MSRFVTFEAKVVVEAPLSFLGGEFFNLDGIYIHGIGVSFLLGMVVISVVKEREERIVSSLGDFIGSFPDMFKVESL